MTHNNSSSVAQKFMLVEALKTYDKKQIVMALNHDMQNKNESNLRKYRLIEEIVKK